MMRDDVAKPPTPDEHKSNKLPAIPAPTVHRNLKGRRLSLSPNRRLIADISWLTRNIPLFPIERWMDLSQVARARKAATTRISWTTLFTRAYAITAARHPLLRRSFMRWPLPHLYEHPVSIASIAMSRAICAASDGESTADQSPLGIDDQYQLYWGQIDRVEDATMGEIQRQLDDYSQMPISKAFRSQTLMSRLPMPVRRIAWLIGTGISGAERAKAIGTFSVSSVAGLGAYNRYHPIAMTHSLTYGPLSESGDCLVTLICDHRVADGSPVARCLQTLESVMQNEIVAELTRLTDPTPNPNRLPE